jgi:hypothetical protein
MGTRISGRALLATGAFLLLGAGPAANTAAADDFCVQNGPSAAVACPVGQFDNLHRANSFAELLGIGFFDGNDTVRVEPGTYAEAVAMGGKPNVTIFGDPAHPRPVITAADSSPTLWLNQVMSGSVVRHLEVRQTSGTAPALQTGTSGGGANPSVRVEDVVLSAAGPCATFYGVVGIDGLTVTQAGGSAFCVQINAGTSAPARGLNVSATGTNSTALVTFSLPAEVEDGVLNAPAGVAMLAAGPTAIRRVRAVGGLMGIQTASNTEVSIADSLITTVGANSFGVLVAATNGPTSIRNATILASGASSIGLSVQGEALFSTTRGIANVSNSIVRGDDRSLNTPVFGANLCGPMSNEPCDPGVINISNSNFVPSSEPGVVDAGANQSADPLFVSPAFGLTQDLHLEAGSPAIDAGASVPAGTTDLDRIARPQGAQTDMGAYEFVPPAPPVDPGAKCVVPKLKGKTVKKAKRALEAADCALGKVKKPKRSKGKLVVRKSKPKAGAELPAGSKVKLKLGPKRK